MKYLQSLDPVVLFVIAVLLLLSVLSWTVIVYKLWETGAVRRQNRMFQGLLWKTDDQESIIGNIDRFRRSTAARLYALAYTRALDEANDLPPEKSSRTDGTISIHRALQGGLARRLRRLAETETDKLDRNIALLATTASTAPFIGLFGTVWGIMVAFRNIGAAGSTSLEIVAPGIAQALITTAIGLAVAIPAAIGYNLLQERIRNIVNENDRFCEDLIAAVGETSIPEVTRTQE